MQQHLSELRAKQSFLECNTLVNNSSSLRLIYEHSFEIFKEELVKFAPLCNGMLELENTHKTWQDVRKATRSRIQEEFDIVDGSYNDPSRVLVFTCKMQLVNSGIVTINGKDYNPTELNIILKRKPKKRVAL